jgi:hypothetical protein
LRTASITATPGPTRGRRQIERRHDSREFSAMSGGVVTTITDDGKGLPDCAGLDKAV